MKTNGVPEKIQIHFIKNDYDAWSVRGYSFLEDKQMGMTEYTRTDAFIEKAVKWLMDNIQDYTDDGMGEHSFILVQDLKEHFKKYMKGE
jgi:hypothetical protein